METNRPRRIPPIVPASLFMGIVTVFLLLILNANPAYASGLLKVSSNRSLDIQFVSSNTNDEGSSHDPGMDVDIGQCNAILDEKRVEFRIINGYPSYKCTIKVRLKNLSEQTIRLQQVKAKIPMELIITQPDLSGGLFLETEEEVSLEFILRVSQNSEENAKYRFSIQLIFVSATDKNGKRE
jgi:hypothetical protein